MRVRAWAIFALLAAAPGPLGATGYQTAKDAYDQGRIEESRTAFAAVANDPGETSRDRVAAMTAVARIEWLVDGNAIAAARQLQAALALHVDECPTRVMLARVLREAGKPAEATIAASDISSCAGQVERDRLLIEQGRSQLDLGNSEAAQRNLAGLSEFGKLAPDANALRLDAALADGRTHDALNAWRDYYWLTNGDAPQGLASEPVRQIFAEGAGIGASLDGQCRLLDLLVRAGFDDAAHRFADRRKLGGAAALPPCRKSQAYFNFRQEFSALILEDYRKMARLGPSDKDGLQKVADDFGGRMSTIFQDTAAALKGLVTATPDDGPIKLVHDAFNLGSTFGYTGGYPSAHIGHIVINETREVEQYGRRAKLNFRVYDRMISNGFQSWIWDGEKQTGGWGSADTIVQIRAPYANSTIATAGLAVDAVARGKAEDQARTRSIADPGLLAAARAQGKKVVYLPGLADRLQLQWIDQIAASIGPKTAPDFARRFAAREDLLTTRHSIWIHEGRHALDGKYLKKRNFTPADLEYRAKLAELLLADYPRMAFGSINDSLVNSDGSHGVANTRIMAAYADWIAAHSAQVRGFDARIAPLLQLDKLSDAQLRTVAAGLADFDVPARKPQRLAKRPRRARSLP